MEYLPGFGLYELLIVGFMGVILFGKHVAKTVRDLKTRLRGF